jgi:carbon-monoxide dehydrogenase medium subunit
MYPAAFEYVIPKSLEEIPEVFRNYGPNVKFLAGGQSLVPLMKLRLARPSCLIDLNPLAELNYITEGDGEIRCGSMTRHIQFEESQSIAREIPLITQAAGHIGDWQVRSRGTIGGALVEADPAGDWGPVILALNARLRCIGPEGERLIEASDFFDFAYTTKLHDDELLTAVDFPIPEKGTIGSYSKLERITGDFAIVSVALQIGLDNTGRCDGVGIGLGGVGVTPIKPAQIESFLLGKRIDPPTIAEACKMLDEAIDPLSDQRGSAAYKRRVLKPVFSRALNAALEELNAT